MHMGSMRLLRMAGRLVGTAKCLPNACAPSLNAHHPPQARWAHRRAGFLLAAAEKFEEGVAAFQSALKTDVRDAGGLLGWGWTAQS